MKRVAVLVFFLTVTAGKVFGAPCAASPTRLCLNGGRFAVDVTWTDFANNTGSGQAVSLTGDTGYFWFFSANNVELIVKVLDGRALNANFWVFYGALSNVEYTVTVTDTATGQQKVYHNPQGHLASHADTAAFYRAADVFALSSDFDNSPNVVLEAMACGLPVVTTDVGGVREFVAEGAGGLVVPPNDAAGLAAALRTYLVSPINARSAGAFNRSRAITEFSWRASALRLLDVYDHVLSARAGGTRATA